MSERELLEFAETFQQDLLSLAEAEEQQALLPEVFTSTMIDTLTEAGEIEEGEACYLRDRGIEVSGYGIEDDEILNLFATDFRGEMPPGRIGRTDVDTALRRLQGFWERCRSGPYHARLEESAEPFDMAQRVHNVAGHLRRIRLFVLTDAVSRIEHVDPEEIDGVEIVPTIWDIQRVHRLITSGMRREAIEIDFERDHGGPIPCLSSDGAAGEYSALLAIFPASVLNEIYGAYGSRLLELNVRSFLQARGKVNRGIRDTLLKAPERFLAYNNGISATASEVVMADLADGGRGIARISHLQIVNGGQTTASIHHAATKDRADVSRAHVQAKITLVPEERLDTIVPLISRFANSQNRVSEADLTATHPFHVRMEELSRTIWAPSGDGTQRQTRWFYERARGQYADAMAREGATPARRRTFKQQHPSHQRIAKTDLAKFENTWDQLPHIVSRGAQKSFVEFMQRIDEQKRLEPDAQFFQSLVAKAILWRSTERIVTREHLPGYRANIVAYSIALLAHHSQQRIDLERIWERQALDEATERALADISHHVRAVITDPPGAGNVTEYCKREVCWQRIKELPVTLSDELVAELVAVSQAGRPGGYRAGGMQPEEQRALERVQTIGADGWLHLSRWAKETGRLESWEQALAFSIGKILRQGRTPARKQVTASIRILEKAQSLGFTPEGT